MPNHRAGFITDHRGVEVPLVQLKHLPPNVDPHVRRTLRLVREDPWLVWLAGMFLGVSIATMLPRLLNLLLGTRFTIDALVTSECATAGGTIIATFLGARWSIQKRITSAVQACLEAELCPSCGYDISEVPVAITGRRTCPECGAAWRLPSM